MPVEALWRRVSFFMQPPALRMMPSPFTGASAPSKWMVVYAILYALIALILAMRAFSWRDL
jgi:hypothetical protein